MEKKNESVGPFVKESFIYKFCNSYNELLPYTKKNPCCNLIGSEKLHEASPASLNDERNFSNVPNTKGIQKRIKAQSSVRLFCIGVPVISNFLGIRKRSSRTLYKTYWNLTTRNLQLELKRKHRFLLPKVGDISEVTFKVRHLFLNIKNPNSS